MTTEQFFSNQEQLEAHWRDFNVIWEKLQPGDVYPPIPTWTVMKDLDSKIYLWRSYLIDALIDANPDWML